MPFEKVSATDRFKGMVTAEQAAQIAQQHKHTKAKVAAKSSAKTVPKVLRPKKKARAAPKTT